MCVRVTAIGQRSCPRRTSGRRATQPGIVRGLRSTVPEALRARTWKSWVAAGQDAPTGHLGVLATGAGMTVSKPLFGVVEMAVRCAALEPVNSCQDATVVATFQLA